MGDGRRGRASARACPIAFCLLLLARFTIPWCHRSLVLHVWYKQVYLGLGGKEISKALTGSVQMSEGCRPGLRLYGVEDDTDCCDGGEDWFEG